MSRGIKRECDVIGMMEADKGSLKVAIDSLCLTTSRQVWSSGHMFENFRKAKGAKGSRSKRRIVARDYRYQKMKKSYPNVQFPIKNLRNFLLGIVNT